MQSRRPRQPTPSYFVDSEAVLFEHGLEIVSINIWLAFRLRAQPKLDSSFAIHGFVELEAGAGGEDLFEGVSKSFPRWRG